MGELPGEYLMIMMLVLFTVGMAVTPTVNMICACRQSKRMLTAHVDCHRAL